MWEKCLGQKSCSVMWRHFVLLLCALTWLKRLTKQGALVSVDGKGTYHKN